MEVREYKLLLPLQQMALRKIAINLWNRFCSDSHSSLSRTNQRFELLVKEAKEKVSLLGLPSLLEVKLLDLMLPIGTEILRWEQYHESLPLKVAAGELGQLCWTSQGTVDYRKSAERLIRLGRVDNLDSYKLSCLYCFDNDIQQFWKKLDELTKKSYFYNAADDDFNYEDESWRTRRAELVTFWAYYLKGNTDFIINQYEDEPKRTFNQYVFESAALSGNKVATEYFFQKLTFEEREVSLMETVRRVIKKRCLENIHFPQDFPDERFADVGIYLLSKLNKAEQTEVFENQPFETLVCFLDWPWQDLFINFAEKIWKYLSSQEYRGLLTILSYDYEFPAFNYENIFIEFFQRSPNHFRNGLFVDRSFETEDVDFRSTLFPYLYEDISQLKMEWFCNLIETNKSECIILVIRSMNRAEKERLIISKFGVDLCVKLFKIDKWYLLEQIIEECELSKEAKDSLKTSFMVYYFS